MYKIVHRTNIRYRFPVSLGNHVTCLKPRNLPHQRLIRNALAIQPTPATLTERLDYFGNALCFFTVQEPHRELVVETCSEVEIDGAPPDVRRLEANIAWEDVVKLLGGERGPASMEASQFSFESPRIRIRPEFAAYGSAVVHSGSPHSGGAARFDRAHPYRFSLRRKVDQRPDAHRRGLQKTPRRLSGFCPRADRVSSLAESCSPLRQRLSSYLPATGEAQAHRCRCLACLGLRLLPGSRLDRCGPH